MRNSVVFDVCGESICACVANIFENQSNTINLTFEAETFKNPKIEILTQSGSTFYDLSVENGVAVGEFPWNDIFGDTSTTTTCRMRYVDGEKVGTWFIWSLSKTTVPAGMIESGYRTLKVSKRMYLGNTVFDINWVASELKQVSGANPSQFNVSDDGEISLKEVESITAKKNENDQIILIGINYTDGTSSINQCVYNADGDLVQFGDIDINWGE